MRQDLPKKRPHKIVPETWFWLQTERAGECLNTMFHTKSDGYGVLRFGGRTITAHRVAWQLMRGEIPPGMCVCHTCDNPACVRIEHLFLGTHADNMEDMGKKGRRKLKCVGAATNRAILNEPLVRLIRGKAAQGCNLAALARELKVSESAVRHVVKRRVWKYLETSNG